MDKKQRKSNLKLKIPTGFNKEIKKKWQPQATPSIDPFVPFDVPTAIVVAILPVAVP